MNKQAIKIGLFLVINTSFSFAMEPGKSSLQSLADLAEELGNISDEEEERFDNFALYNANRAGENKLQEQAPKYLNLLKLYKEILTSERSYFERINNFLLNIESFLEFPKKTGKISEEQYTHLKQTFIYLTVQSDNIQKSLNELYAPIQNLLDLTDNDEQIKSKLSLKQNQRLISATLLRFNDALRRHIEIFMGNLPKCEKLISIGTIIDDANAKNPSPVDSIGSVFITPIQRATRYILLAKQIFANANEAGIDEDEQKEIGVNLEGLNLLLTKAQSRVFLAQIEAYLEKDYIDIAKLDVNKNSLLHLAFKAKAPIDLIEKVIITIKQKEIDTHHTRVGGLVYSFKIVQAFVYKPKTYYDKFLGQNINNQTPWDIARENGYEEDSIISWDKQLN